ncbi:MAG: carbohydrate-binding domain-containing protein [Lachnospiraceae bacterium]|nr:carbohydrate-binding domain-containing protein [Lachnospiraceae bacterium]
MTNRTDRQGMMRCIAIMLAMIIALPHGMTVNAAETVRTDELYGAAEVYETASIEPASSQPDPDDEEATATTSAQSGSDDEESSVTASDPADTLASAGNASALDWDSVIAGECPEGVSVDDTSVPGMIRVTVSQNGTYTLTGEWTNAVIEINKNLKRGVGIILDSLTVNNENLNAATGEDCGVITCAQGTPLTITLKGSYVLTGSSSYTDEPEALISVKKDGTLNIDGSGSLTLNDPMSDDTAKAAKAAGLDPADGIKLGSSSTGGTFNLNSGILNINVQGDGVKAKNGRININGGTLKAETGGDGMKAKKDLETGSGTVTVADGTVNIESYDDGIQAENIDIQGGTVDIVTLFADASGSYYSNGKSYTAGKNVLYESGGDNNKIELVTVDTGSHKGLKAGTKAETYYYGYTIANDNSSSLKTNATDENSGSVTASGGLTISGGDISIDTRSAGLKANKVTSSGYTATASQVYIIGAPDDGIKSNNNIDITGGNITVNSGDDGITASGVINITGGTVDIQNAYEGIEGAAINIGVHNSSTGPVVSTFTADDGMNSTSKTLTYFYESADNEDFNYKKVSVSTSSGNNINIFSGTVTVKIDSENTHSTSLAGKTVNYTADGDGIDCNGSLALYGGVTKVYGQSSGANSPLDTNDGITLYKNATVFAAGASDMASESIPKYGDGGYITYGGSGSGGGPGGNNPGGPGSGGPGSGFGGSNTGTLAAGSTFSIKSGSSTVVSEVLPYAAAFVIYGSFTDSSSYTVTTASGSTTATPSYPSNKRTDDTEVIPVTSVTLDRTTLSVNKGDTAKLSATVVPSNATDKTVTWKSYDASVAKVSSAGLVTGVSGGKTTIEAEAGGISALCTVYVTEEGNENVDPDPVDPDPVDPDPVDPTEWESVRTVAINTTYTKDAGNFSVNKPVITFDSDTFAYTGKAVTPDPKVTFNGVELKRDADYTLTFRNNRIPGTATVTVKGTGEFKGSAAASFTIEKPDLKDCAIYVDDVILKSEGTLSKPAIRVYSPEGVLIPASNYEAVFENAVTPGTAVAKLSAKSGSRLLSGTATANYTVLPVGTDRTRLISNAKVQSVTARDYTGSAVEPEPVVTGLTKDTDYSVSYINNVNAGTATMVIEGAGNCYGVKFVNFRIKALRTKDSSVQIALSDDSSYYYTGYALKPQPLITAGGETLLEGRDYTLSWSKNTGVTNGAQGKLRVRFKGNRTYTETVNFTIRLRPWSEIAASAEKDETDTSSKRGIPVFYSGTEMITLKKGAAYTAGYTFDKSTGFVTVAIKGAGPYKGQLSSVTYAYTGT